MRILILYFCTFLCLIQSVQVEAMSIRRTALPRLIESSPIICRGRIIEVVDTDSLLQSELNNVVRHASFDRYKDAVCSRCSKTALFVVEKTLKGKVETDTLPIAYDTSFMFMLPDFSEGKAYILFLNQLKGFEVYAKQDPRTGMKSEGLEAYEQFIREYLSLTNSREKRDWMLRVWVQPELSQEGSLIFRSPIAREFSEDEQSFLVQGLLQMDFAKSNYRSLLEFVLKLGENDALLEKCFDRLALIDESDVWLEGSALVEAIYALEPQEHYRPLKDKILDRHSGYSEAQKLAWIKELLTLK